MCRRGHQDAFVGPCGANILDGFLDRLGRVAAHSGRPSAREVLAGITHVVEHIFLQRVFGVRRQRIPKPADQVWLVAAPGFFPGGTRHVEDLCVSFAVATHGGAVDSVGPFGRARDGFGSHGAGVNWNVGRLRRAWTDLARAFEKGFAAPHLLHFRDLLVQTLMALFERRAHGLVVEGPSADADRDFNAPTGYGIQGRDRFGRQHRRAHRQHIQ